jgi:uncharacterized protein
MPLKVNVRLLKHEDSRFEGELPVSEVVGDFQDEVIRIPGPIRYALDVARQGHELRINGQLDFPIECDCGRCLKTFVLPVSVPDFAALIPLEGDEALVLDGDFADLTPFLREDTLLVLPTNPLCSPDCRGLAAKASARDSRLRNSPASKEETGRSPWDALDNLNL